MIKFSNLQLAFACIILNASAVYAQGQWLPAASLHETRQRHGATLLNDGRLLASGGAYDFWGEAVRATCEIYDPNTDTWTPAASMNTPRSSHTTTILSDGRVLVTGGYGGSGYALRSCEIYNPVTDIWTSVAAMHVPRYRHQAIMLNDDSLLVIGGRQGNIDGHGAMDIWSPDATCEIYSISANTWTQVASMHEKRVECGVALLPDGRVLVSAGINAKSDIGNWAQPSTPTCEIYDPMTDTWALTDSYAGARNYVRLVTLDNNRVLSVGGELNRDALADCYRFNPNSEKWHTTGTLNAPRITAEIVKLANGDVMTIGGWSYLWTQQTKTAERYLVHPSEWEKIPDMSQDRGFHSATLLSNGDILVVGGTTSGGSAITSCEIYRAEVGNTPLSITAIGDIPNDEGHRVKIYWTAHSLDIASQQDNIITYRIYRRDDADGDTVAGLREGRWNLATTVPALHLTRYTAVVPVSDNSSVDQPLHETFAVVATRQGGVSYASLPVEGEAFDNRGPATVRNVAITSSVEGSQLTWERPISADVDHYEIYRGSRSDFPVTPQAKIGITALLSFNDVNGEPENYYRVVAVDRSGNMGVAIAPRSSAVSSAPIAQGIPSFSIGCNYPQPFASATRIPLELPAAAYVEVKVYDQFGHLMASTLPLQMSAGKQEIVINADRLDAGIYYCVVKAGDHAASLPLTVVR